MTGGVEVRRADIPDLRQVVSTLCAGFQDDPVSGWLIPDYLERQWRHPRFFRVFVDHAVMWGEGASNDGLCRGGVVVGP